MLTIHGLEITLNSQYERFNAPGDFPEKATSVLSNETIACIERANLQKVAGQVVGSRQYLSLRALLGSQQIQISVDVVVVFLNMISL